MVKQFNRLQIWIKLELKDNIIVHLTLIDLGGVETLVETLISKSPGWLGLSIASKTITNGLCESDVALSLQKTEAGP